jgi:hypothetical protein
LSQGIAQVIADVSKVEKKIWGLLESTFTSLFPTPTAAPAADQPTALSGFLGRPALTLPEPYRLAHTSDTTSTSPL